MGKAGKKGENPTKKLTEVTKKLKRTQEMLHLSKDGYRQLVENADWIILQIDENGIEENTKSK